MNREEAEEGTRLTLLIPREDIAAAIQRLALELDQVYSSGPPVVMVAILKGAFVFLADLARQMSVPVGSMEFIRVSSYGANQTTSGEPIIAVGIPAEAVRGQEVLVVEDIVDTGLTTAAVLEQLQNHRPASIRVCTLLDKPSRRQREVPIDHVGFTIPDLFVVGYGLDFDQRYRELPDLYALVS